jgi:serine/threonine protein kinase
MAPELMFDEENYSYEVDIFSFGMVLLEVLRRGKVGHDGFAERSPRTKFRLDEGELRAQLPKDAPESLVILALQVPEPYLDPYRDPYLDPYLRPYLVPYLDPYLRPYLVPYLSSWSSWPCRCPSPLFSLCQAMPPPLRAPTNITFPLSPPSLCSAWRTT